MPHPGPSPRFASRVGVAARFAKARAQARLAYPGDVAAQALGDLLVGLVGVLFLSALFARVPHVAGWSLHETLVVWGLAECVTALTSCVFAGAAVFNQRYLLGGELDRLLLRPLHPWAQVLLDHAGLQGAVTGLLGCAMIAVGLYGADPVPTRLWLLPLALLGGSAMLGGILTGLCAAGFRLHHRGSLVGMVQQAAAFGRYPADLFSPSLRALLTGVFPATLLAAVPTAWVLGHPVWAPLALAQPLLGIGALAAGTALWNRGLRGYASSGT